LNQICLVQAEHKVKLNRFSLWYNFHHERERGGEEEEEEEEEEEDTVLQRELLLYIVWLPN
jgi:hypothetical protein